MVDRGISENYLIYWLEVASGGRCAGVPLERVEQCLRVAKHIARLGGRPRAPFDIYDQAFRYFNGNQILAAEYLRRFLVERANPTPIDDSFPSADSPIWEEVVSAVRYYDSYSRVVPAPRYRPQPASISRTPYFE